jgi:hypothetical protein
MPNHDVAGGVVDVVGREQDLLAGGIVGGRVLLGAGAGQPWLSHTWLRAGEPPRRQRRSAAAA